MQDYFNFLKSATYEKIVKNFISVQGKKSSRVITVDESVGKSLE